MSRKVIREPENMVKTIVEKKKRKEDDLFKEAKDLGLFKKNKRFKTYEIIIPANIYDKI